MEVYVIEIGLGSYGQRKMSSRFLPNRFSSRLSAELWANEQTSEARGAWGNWDYCRIIERKPVEQVPAYIGQRDSDPDYSLPDYSL